MKGIYVKKYIKKQKGKKKETQKDKERKRGNKLNYFLMTISGVQEKIF